MNFTSKKCANGCTLNLKIVDHFITLNENGDLLSVSHQNDSGESIDVSSAHAYVIITS